MPVPTLITDLSTTAALNSPDGSIDIPSSLDDYQRAHASFIAQLRDRTATDLTNTPAGSIAATTVQGAINEIVSDLAASSGASLVGDIPAGIGSIATTVQDKLREMVGIKGFGEVADGVTDDQAALAKALSQRGTLMPSGSNGILYVDGGGRTFAIASDLQIPTNTRLTNCKIFCKSGAKIMLGGASSGDVHYYSGIPGVMVIGDLLGSVPTSTNLVSVNYLNRGDMRNVVAINALGAGIKTTINTRNMTWGPTYAFNCCQNVAVITGAIEMFGSDHTVSGYVIGQATFTDAEVAAEIAAPGSTQFPYRVGVILNMSTSTVGGGIRGEISGFAGVYVKNSFSADFGSLLADQNAGHGVYFATNCGDFKADISGSDNNRLNGAYDTLTMADATLVRYNIRSISTDELGGIGSPMRYHLRVAASPAQIDRGTVAHPRGRLNGATRMSLPAVAPSIIEGRHPHLPFTAADTTPSVDGGTCFKFANAGSVSVTTFNDGYEGKRISVLGDGLTTLVHPGIVCPLGRSYLVKTNDVVDLELRAGVWVVVSPIRKLSVSSTVDPTSIAIGGSLAATVAVTGASMGDIVQVTFSLDLQGLTLTGYVSAPDTVTYVLANNTAGAINLAVGSFRVFVTRI